MKKYGLFILYTLLIVIIVAALSSGLTLLVTAGGRVSSDDQVLISKKDYETLTRYQRLDQLREYIRYNYIEDTEDQSLIYGAAQGMFYTLNDPYSFFMTPEQTAAATEEEKGVYHGIGCQLVVDPEDALITITRVYKGSPAESAGIVPGDKIVKVFGIPYTGYEMNEAVKHMRGEPGTSADITILREGETIDLTVPRAEVTVNRVETRMLGDDVGLITLYEFEGNALAGFKEALKQLEKEKAKGMIVDLRGNPGGVVDTAAQICDLLLPECTIVTIEDKHGNVDTYSSDPSMVSLPTVVLVNGMSASASEIMAAALKDNGRATLVGTQTFGKGIVQNVYVFKDDNSSMHLTTAYYYTPNGENIHKTGITPDRIIDLPEELKKNPTKVTDENDVQLTTAVEELKKLIGDD